MMDRIRSNEHGKYDMLDRARNDFFARQYGSSTKGVESAEEEHKESMRFKDALEGNLEENKEDGEQVAKGSLLKWNQAPTIRLGPSNSRTILLLDATRSMSSLLNNAKNTVSIRIYQTNWRDFGREQVRSKLLRIATSGLQEL